MRRFRYLNGERSPFTAEEEAQRDAEEAKWEAEKPKRMWEGIRQKRNQLLQESDWIETSKNSDGTLVLSEIELKKWREYRQKLRDILQTYKNPEDVKWPEKPE